MSTVFLSYARGDDEAFVRRLHDDLEAAGFDAWFDRVDMPQRPLTFHQEIEDAIRERNRLIYVAGPCASSSDYVRQEWRFALACDKHVIPLLRSGEYESALPGQLALMHCEDFRDDSRYRAKLTKLIEGLQQPEPPLGALKAVPNLPPSFLARPLLMRRVKDALLVDLQAPVVVTGAAATADDQGDASQQVGLQGMGGIGKSVLAAAVARDREVRRAYPDGVVWIRCGQQPNLAVLMGELAAQLGCDDTFGTVAEGAGILKASCADKALLLVLDDVWSARDAEAFDVLGPRCRMLVTTRDAGVLHTLQGELFPVELLAADQARQLLADNARMQESALPADADEVVRECGCLPLALALAGGMVARRRPSKGGVDSGSAWRNVLERLRRADLEKVRDRHAINPAHESIWRAMAASVDVLEPDERMRFSELSVFQPDQGTPERALATLWAHTGGLDELDCEELLVELAERSLVRIDVDHEGNRRFSLHDLLFDFAKRITESPDALNQQLLDAYRAKCSNGWSSGPNDGYFFEHLAHHLHKSGRDVELQALLLHFDWLRAKLHSAGIRALLSDYDFASESEGSRLVQGALSLSAHVLAKDTSQLAGQLVGRLRPNGTPQIRELLERVNSSQESPWLRPLRTSLTAPGGPLLRTLEGHTRDVVAVEATQDGRRAISASDDRTLRVWDRETGVLVHTLEGHTDVVNAVAVTLDGRHAVSASRDTTLKLWELEAGTLVHTLEGHTDVVNAVALTLDGRHAVSASWDGTLKLWDLEAGALVHTLEGHKDAVIAVAVTPDARRAVSASQDQTLKLWNLQAGTLVHTLEGHKDAVWRVAVTPYGHCAISASLDQTLKVWDLEAGALVHTLSGHEDMVVAVAVTPDGRGAVSASMDDTLKLWDLEAGTLVHTLEGHKDAVIAVAVTPDGRRAVSGSWDHTLRLWDLEAGAPVHTLKGHTSWVVAVAVTPDGRCTVSASRDDTLKVWDLEASAPVHSLEGHKDAVIAVAVTPDRRHAISASQDRNLKVWHLDSGALVHTLEGHTRAVSRVAVTPDGRRAVSAGGELEVWDLEAGALVHTLEGHKSTRVTVTPDGHCAISASLDRTLKVWDLEAGALVHTLEGHKGAVFAIAVTPDGRRAVSGAYDQTLKVWDLESGALVHTLEGHKGAVPAVAVTPDGRHAVSASADSALKLWNLEAGTLVHSLEGHTRVVWRVAVTPDGRRAISASDDRTLRVWDLETGVLVHTFEGHTGGVVAVAVTPDGRHAVSASRDHTLKLWDLVRGEIEASFSADCAVRCCAAFGPGVTIVAGDASGKIHHLVLENSE